MSHDSKHLFCFGLGFSALTFARKMQAKGWKVSGTIRPDSQKDQGKRERLEAEGIVVHSFERTLPLIEASTVLGDVTHILSSVPPGKEGDCVLELHAAEIAKCKNLEWVGYLSTTGVYGNRDGGVVFEDDSLNPSSPRSEQRIQAEKEWLGLTEVHGIPVHVFRLAGIYGPGRSPLDSLKSGRVKQRIDKPGHIFSRIHVEDIANVLDASIKRPRAGRIYNVCDSAPEEPSKVTTYASRLLGIDPPPLVAFDQAEMSPMARTFWLDNKRVDNSRIISELGVKLDYPDYQSGLKSLL
ncbi:epimerase [Kiloniella spongiae]|uniref:Epimerase n=1 Tax=Kiloniella spongiae TaxID=1489064 RepID=A0A0H2N0R4_9PROT|nr:SDR family oxidoreductase [Kiloniella spongiae]KLN62480.1 epimerase [Kiloniella spongiae]